MLPGNSQIITRLQSALSQVKDNTNNPEQQSLLYAMGSALHELHLRCDSGFFCDYYLRGRSLLEEGIKLMPGNQENMLEELFSLPTQLDRNLNTESIGRHLDQLSGALTRLIKTLGGNSDKITRKFLSEVISWEMALYQKRAEKPADGESTRAHGFTRQNLERYLQAKFPERKNLRVEKFTEQSGGFSKLTFMLNTFDDIKGEQALVLRANQPVQSLKFPGNDVINEYALVDTLFNMGVPIAEPLWLEADQAIFGSAFFVSRKSEGEIIGSGHKLETYRTITPQMKANLVKTLVRIHKLPLDDSSGLSTNHVLQPWRDVDNLRQIALKSADWFRNGSAMQITTSSPMIQRIYDWLVTNAPDSDGEPVLLHGDYGLHNILVQGNEIVVTLDWEQAKIGDPAEDFIPMFLSLGVEYDEECVALYQMLGGQPVSYYRICYYRVLVALKVLIFNASVTENLQQNRQASMNFFIWMTDAVYASIKHINQLIAQAEAAKSYREL